MRMTEVKQDILYVRMLGSFSIQWNGKLIAGGSKASESQLTSLLQILIHNRARGVPCRKRGSLLQTTSSSGKVFFSGPKRFP